MDTKKFKTKKAKTLRRGHILGFFSRNTRKRNTTGHVRSTDMLHYYRQTAKTLRQLVNFENRWSEEFYIQENLTHRNIEKSGKSIDFLNEIITALTFSLQDSLKELDESVMFVENISSKTGENVNTEYLLDVSNFLDQLVSILLEYKKGNAGDRAALTEQYGSLVDENAQRKFFNKLKNEMDDVYSTYTAQLETARAKKMTKLLKEKMKQSMKISENININVLLSRQMGALKINKLEEEVQEYDDIIQSLIGLKVSK